MTVAAESLVGCEDAVWSVAAPTACALICSIGAPLCVLHDAWHCLLRPACASALQQLCQDLVLLSDGQLWGKLVLCKPVERHCIGVQYTAMRVDIPVGVCFVATVSAYLKTSSALAISTASDTIPTQLNTSILTHLVKHCCMMHLSLLQHAVHSLY